MVSTGIIARTAVTDMGAHKGYQWVGKVYDVDLTGLGCIVCGVKDCAAFTTAKVLPDCAPEVLERKFRQAGWVIGSRRAKNRCPEHATKIRRLKQEMKMGMRMSDVITNLKGNSSETEANNLNKVREATAVEQRRIFVRLAEVFDEEKGQYIGKHNDELIAKELNLPRALVTKLREESGWHIKGDPAVMALKQEVQELRQLLEDFDRRILELEKARS